MKGFMGMVIKILLFPLKLLGDLFGFIGKPVKFIETQRRIEARHRTNRDSFYKQKRQSSRDNDEIA